MNVEVPEDSMLRRWVRTTFGADARPLDGLVCRSENFDSLLFCDRPGQEPGEFSADQFSAQRFIIDPEGEIIFGTAPVERAEEQLGLRLSSGDMVWTARVNGRVVPPEPHAPVASAPAPANGTATAASQQDSEQGRIEAARQRRLQKHPQLRQHVAWLVAHHFGGSQAALARKLQIRAALLSEYNTQMARSQKLSQTQLDAYHTKITSAIKRAELPSEPHTAEPSRVSPTTVPETTASSSTEPRHTRPAPRPAPRTAASTTSTAPVAVLTLNLSETSGHHGSQVLILDVGQEHAVPAGDERWNLPAAGMTLRLRPGLRARYTFGPRDSHLGGRTFEWWVETLSSDAELAHNGGPLWVAREVTGKGAVSAVHARSDEGGRIVGRAVASASGRPTGPSTPALLWRAIETRFKLPRRSLRSELTRCGLTHAKVQQLLAITAPTVQANATNSIGSRSGGISGLKPGGRQLR